MILQNDHFLSRYISAIVLSYMLFSPPLLAQTNEFVQGEIIVKFQPELIPLQLTYAMGRVTTGHPQLDAFLTKRGAYKVGKMFKSDIPGANQWYFIKFPLNQNVTAFKSELETLPYVIVATQNRIAKLGGVPNDPQYNQQYYLQKVQMENAWDVEKGDPNVLIGIIDNRYGH